MNERGDDHEPLPEWVGNVRTTSLIESPPPTRRWPVVVGAITLAAMTGLAGVLGWLLFAAERRAAEPTETAGLVEDLPAGDDADRMSIRIETPVAQTTTTARPEGAGDDAGSSRATQLPQEAVPGATATVREDGLVYFEGAFRSQEEADRFVTRAGDVFGPDAIVEAYTIDPNAATPAASDVVLDKPVLFESGSATIHPDYIPFLEACGDVLRLNPHITMSIAAFTDSRGDEQYNLELSRRRAQAIVDFYTDLDVDPDQLVGTGLGETVAFADDPADEASPENRRAMLELLNVMAEEPAGG